MAPLLQSLLWLSFLATWRTFKVAERQLALLRAASPAAVPTLQLEITSPVGAAAVHEYEIGLVAADHLTSSYVIPGPEAAPPPAGRQQTASVQLFAPYSGAQGAAAPQPLQVQIAARGADGCIAYGGERSLIAGRAFESPGAPTGALVVRVILQRLPQSICR